MGKIRWESHIFNLHMMHLFFYHVKIQVLINCRRLLDCFFIMTGLNINYSKSTLIPFRYEERIMDEISRELLCLVEALSIIYLGIPFRANIRGKT